MESQFLGYETIQITRFDKGQTDIQFDKVVEEYPIALVYNGISHAVMMATPTDIAEFAKGFSLSEGVIGSLKELYSIDIIQNSFGIQVEMNISSKAFMALKEHRRMLIGRTGCGLCGIESLQQFHFSMPTISHMVQPEWLKEIPNAVRQLKSQQKITAVTGGAHAAAWVEDGIIQAIFEDVGRHNALDKLLGYISAENFDLSNGFVVMTSRASYELIRKCAVLNIALLATISAPTSMAIEMAQAASLTLASFCRGDGFVIYT
ncbi:formate dehydrogenase family accessory protein FdhD [Acinetobacter dispersus]|uniref:Sulfur carrier protein FdhD n=2 Tax=Acinetobacter TaxID=469 RepID=N8W8L3_9GAMM|nr:MULTISPECIES: formate dehydrogenase accessory sulfurtransferase FdhD [Acinetobacter]ENU91264.1 formate dehydrogenase family accessory protein FdhD [Acinetobacter vivianii]ENW97178.1 formate dehydrogenase family accessory protein FdhD [Acinetobacter dispersus]